MWENEQIDFGITVKLSKPDGSKLKTASSQELMGGFVLVTYESV